MAGEGRTWGCFLLAGQVIITSQVASDRKRALLCVFAKCICMDDKIEAYNERAILPHA